VVGMVCLVSLEVVMEDCFRCNAKYDRCNFSSLTGTMTAYLNPMFGLQRSTNCHQSLSSRSLKSEGPHDPLVSPFDLRLIFRPSIERAIACLCNGNTSVRTIIAFF